MGAGADARNKSKLNVDKNVDMNAYVEVELFFTRIVNIIDNGTVDNFLSDIRRSIPLASP